MSDASARGVTRRPVQWPATIAIDGPAGAGKSTIAAALAEQLGYLYFDTGVLYRSVTLAALRRQVPVDDGEKLGRLVHTLQIAVEPASVADGRTLTVLLNGEDVTWAIRTPEVDQNVSAVSAHRAVRLALLARQREIASRGKVIMAGRDIGTVVLPDADLKIYLAASPEERARRRAADEAARGVFRPFPEVLDSIIRRDDLDSHRDISPLRIPEDAVVIETDGLDVNDVLAAITGIVRAHRNGR